MSFTSVHMKCETEKLS